MWRFLIFADCFGTSNISDILRLCPAWLPSYLGHAERYGTKWTKERDKRTHQRKNTKIQTMDRKYQKIDRSTWGVRSTMFSCQIKQNLWLTQSQKAFIRNKGLWKYPSAPWSSQISSSTLSIGRIICYHHKTGYLIPVCQNEHNLPKISTCIIISIANQQHHIYGYRHEREIASF